MRETLRVLVDRDVAVNPEMPGPLVQVLAAGVDIEVAAGVVDRATGAPLEPGMLFRICCLTVSSNPESRNQSAQMSSVRTGIPTISHPSDVKLEATAT
jgi:hypothetical protein